MNPSCLSQTNTTFIRQDIQQTPASTICALLKSNAQALIKELGCSGAGKSQDGCNALIGTLGHLLIQLPPGDLKTSIQDLGYELDRNGCTLQSQGVYYAALRFLSEVYLTCSNGTKMIRSGTEGPLTNCDVGPNSCHIDPSIVCCPGFSCKKDLIGLLWGCMPDLP